MNFGEFKILATLFFYAGISIGAFAQKKIPAKTQIRTITTLDDAELIENSGMMFFDGKVWFQCDGGSDPALFAYDTTVSKVVRTVKVKNAINHDWEDITHDSAYVYIGDFGNNNGDRKNLQILKILKSDILKKNEVTAEFINFSYADQLDFTKRRGEHDFDCEAMIAIGDSLFLFTKNWADYRTRIYGLSSKPGNYSISPIAIYDIGGLVTGAAYDKVNGILMLVAYKFDNKFFVPFLLASPLFDSTGLRSLNFRKLTINKEFHQMEAITETPWGAFLFSNEAIYKKYLTVPAKLFEIRGVK
jgi:hypothetical protein